MDRFMSWNFFLRFLSLSSIILVIASKGRSWANHVRLMVRGELIKGLETLRALRKELGVEPGLSLAFSLA